MDKPEEVLESGKNQIDLATMFNHSLVVLENGQEIPLTQEDWDYGIKHGEFKKYGKHLKIVNKYDNSLVKAGLALEIAGLGVTFINDTQNQSDDVKSGILPYSDTTTTIASIAAGKLTTTVLASTGCIAISLISTPVGCAIAIAVVGLGVSYAVNEGGEFVFKEVLTRENKEKLENAPDYAKETYMPRRQNEAQFVENLCRALGGGC